MTRSEALTELERLAKLKKVSKSSLTYKSVVAAINNPGIPQICGKNTGSGKHSSSTSWLDSAAYICSIAGIEYTTFNEAPQGGKHGDRITIQLG